MKCKPDSLPPTHTIAGRRIKSVIRLATHTIYTSNPGPSLALSTCWGHFLNSVKGEVVEVLVVVVVVVKVVVEVVVEDRQPYYYYYYYCCYYYCYYYYYYFTTAT